jgi:hypothetical protein
MASLDHCLCIEHSVQRRFDLVLESKAIPAKLAMRVLQDTRIESSENIRSHLWRVKRVESAISRGWMRVTSGSRLFERIPSAYLFRVLLRCFPD